MLPRQGYPKRTGRGSLRMGKRLGAGRQAKKSSSRFREICASASEGGNREPAKNSKREDTHMTRRHLNHVFGMAALACLMLIPGLAHAACTNTPSFPYAPVAKAGGTATVWITAPAGCLWEVTSQASWIRI